jgi:hypothetical protein
LQFKHLKTFNIFSLKNTSVQGNARAKKWEWVGRGAGGEGMGDFWDSIGNISEENT